MKLISSGPVPRPFHHLFLKEKAIILDDINVAHRNNYQDIRGFICNMKSKLIFNQLGSLIEGARNDFRYSGFMPDLHQTPIVTEICSQ